MADHKNTGLSDEARRQLAPLFDMFHELGCRFVFQAPSVPATPKADPVIVQGWALGKVPIMVSIRATSGRWMAFFSCSSANEAEDLQHVRKYLDAIVKMGPKP